MSTLFNKIANIGEFFTGPATADFNANIGFQVAQKGDDIHGKSRDISRFDEIKTILRDEPATNELSREFAVLREALARYALSSDDFNYITSLGAISMAEQAAQMGANNKIVKCFSAGLSGDTRSKIVELVFDLGLQEIHSLMLRDPDLW